VTLKDDLIAQLAEVGRDAVGRRLVAASGGNVSARLDDGTFIVTRTGSWLDRLTADDFCVISTETGEKVSGQQPSSEYLLHLRVYQERPDVGSVIHLHQQMTVLVDALGLEVKPLTMDQAHYLRRIGRMGFFPNASAELGNAAGEASRTSNAIVMAHHGAATLGDTPDMAFRRALNLEEAAAASYYAHLAGQTGLAFPADGELPAHSGVV